MHPYVMFLISSLEKSLDSPNFGGIANFTWLILVDRLKFVVTQKEKLMSMHKIVCHTCSFVRVVQVCFTKFITFCLNTFQLNANKMN